MFATPMYLWLLCVVPLILWRYAMPQRRAAIGYSSVRGLNGLRPTLRLRLMWLPSALTVLAIIILIVGLARPRKGREQTITNTEGIAIEMVVDRSGSMQAMDFKIDGENVDRLTAIKNVAAKFVVGDGASNGRFSDLVGLVTFAGFADGVTPLTLDHGFLVSQLNQEQIVTSREEDGTAIGDAIALAVEKLNALDLRRALKVKSKVIILLTDGENTAGEMEPMQAAELAKTFGIKIYTIGVGTKGRAPILVDGPFGRQKVVRWMQVNIDEETLEKVASTTGGEYYRATDTQSLENIYAKIDAMEKTDVESLHFVDYRELAILSLPTRAGTLPPLLLIAFALLALRLLLETTWLRELT